MKYLTFIILFFIIIGCKDSVSLYDDFSEEIVINAPINLDSSVQKITILKSFPHDNIKNIENYFIKNAEIKLFNGKYLYNFMYNNHYYYCENFLDRGIPELNLDIDVGNKKYNASIVPPNKLNFIMLKTAWQIPNPPSLHYSWMYRNAKNEKVGYVGLLLINYSLKSENDSIRYQYIIPDKIINENNEKVFVYDNLSQIDFKIYNQDIVDEAIKCIGESYEKKTEIQIWDAEFNVYVLDKNMASYFSSTNRPNKGFTLILDQVEFTNFNKGRGIFGAFFKYTNKLSISHYYIEQFGYRYKL